MTVESLHPGVTIDMVHENTGFALPIREPLEQTPSPAEDVLRVLREEVDPHRYILGRN